MLPLPPAPDRTAQPREEGRMIPEILFTTGLVLALIVIYISERKS
jgi:hypothetical protein